MKKVVNNEQEHEEKEKENVLLAHQSWSAAVGQIYLWRLPGPRGSGSPILGTRQ